MSGPKTDAQAARELAELEAEIHAQHPDPPCTGCTTDRRAGVRLDDLVHVECAAALSRVGEVR